MLRAPIWTTSAWAWTASACWLSSSSVTTGRPVSARASERISSASRPRPLNANGLVRGLKAPPRSMEAPACLKDRATPSGCSLDSTVHGPAMRQNVSPPPTLRPSMLTIVGCSWLSSDDASLYGRLIGTTRSTPPIPSSPSSATPSGSPIAPMAVVSSPGITTTCTPVCARRSWTASISACVAWGVITIIMRTGMVPHRDIRVVRHEAPGLRSEVALGVPGPPLRGLVRGYQGFAERTDAPIRRREVPTGRGVLILDLGDGWDVTAAGGGDVARRRSFAAAVDDAPAFAAHGGRARCVQVDLAPL